MTMDFQGRVLIVDDNATNVDILRRILRKEYALEMAADGEECLAKVPVFKPQLVLLDIMMLGIDGYETCRQIKSIDRGECVHVILVSGKGTTADRVRGYEALADDYIVKPFDHEELLSKVRAHFRLRNLQTERQRRSVHESFARLCAVVSEMSADISQHSHVIEDVQREINTCETTGPDALIHAMVRLADSNRATQQRLAASERKLREQTREIESHGSEARTDALTLLPNRRAFDEELARRIAQSDASGGRFCLAMHPAGDEVLRTLGRVLGQTARPMGTVARLGGDEFVVILPGMAMEDAKRGTARIRESIEQCPLQIEQKTLPVTASIGLAQRLPGEDGPSLLRRADQSLYASKSAGRNCVHWHDGKQSHPVDDGGTCPAGRPTGEPLHNAPPLVAQPEADGGAITRCSSTA
jgi:diguanylate cyclase (GGDEF)-like protein